MRVAHAPRAQEGHHRTNCSTSISRSKHFQHQAKREMEQPDRCTKWHYEDHRQPYRLLAHLGRRDKSRERRCGNSWITFRVKSEPTRKNNRKDRKVFRQSIKIRAENMAHSEAKRFRMQAAIRNLKCDQSNGPLHLAGR